MPSENVGDERALPETLVGMKEKERKQSPAVARGIIVRTMVRGRWDSLFVGVCVWSMWVGGRNVVGGRVWAGVDVGVMYAQSVHDSCRQFFL